MRKHIIFLIVLLIFTVNGFLKAQTINMRLPDTTVVSGNNIDIPIYADSNLTGRNIMSYMLQLNFNSSMFQPIAVIVSGTLSAPFGTPAFNTSVPGKITIAGAGSSPLTGSGKFIYIRFLALQSGGLYLNFSVNANNFFNEGSPLMSFRDGYIGISAPPSITVYPESGIITKGESLQFYVSGGTPPFQWSVSNPAVAGINSSGLLTANQFGTTKVIAQDNSGLKDTSGIVEIRAMRLSIPTNLSQWQGANIDIPINTTNLSGLNIYSGNLNISYNHNILTPVEVIKNGSLLASYPLPVMNSNNPGILSLAFAGLSPLSGSGTLVYIRFHVSTQNTGFTNINFITGLFNEEFLPNFTNGDFSTINLPILSISPNSGNIVAGETQQFTVNGGGILPFLWNVSDTSIATISQSGILTGKKSGIVNITVHDSVGATANSGNFQIYDTRINMPEIGACPSSSFFYYPVMITSLPSAQSVLSVQASISFNASYLNFMDIVTTSTLTQGWTFFKNPSNGQIILAGSGTSSFNSAGSLMYLKFSFKPSFVIGSNAYVNINNIVLNEGIPLPLVDINGNISGSYPLNAGSITGTTNVTQGQQGLVYSIPDIYAATDYIWTLPTGASIISGNNSNTITVNYSNSAVSGNITVKGHNDCGDGGVSTLGITVVSVPVSSLFTAAVSNEWENGVNWDHGVPGSITNATIQTGKLAVVNSNNYQCNNLIISPLGKLTINETKNLNVNATLTLQSDVSGTASLINKGSLTTVANIIQRYIHISVPDEFHQLSSPVLNQSISAGFSPVNESFYAWNEVAGNWIPFENPAFIGLNGSNSFVPGRGYAISYTSTSTKSFAGVLNNAVVNSTLNVTAGIYAGWNFIGNPYPSAINWNTSAGFSRSMLANAGSGERAYWIWNPLIGNYGCFISNAVSGTNGVSHLIASTQGFWVKAESNGVFSFNNNACEHSSQLWLKTSTAENNSIRLKVSTTANQYSDEMIINFGNLNDERGAEKMFSLYQTAASLYSTKLNKNWSINNLSSTSGNPVVPFSFKAGVDGNYTITASNLNSFTTPTYIYIKDLFTNSIKDMNQYPDYSFAATVNDNANRFQLLFASAPMQISDNNNENTSIYIFDNSIYINSDDKLQHIEIYNILGEIVKTLESTNGKIIINMHAYASAYYIVKLQTSKNVFTQKVFIN
ncbi:MAG: cohesin domain-containing protein [Bacteroidales bacterium]